MDSKRLNHGPLRTVVIGSGNVASAIAPALSGAGAVDVTAVFSPTPAHAGALAERLPHARAVSRPEDVPADAELYLLAVKDDVIARLATELRPVPEALWLHTSGGVDPAVMRPLSARYGVFYPLQTFSKGVEVDLAQVPVFVEASDEADRRLVEELGAAISPKVYYADSIMRCRLHAAAVFACNFTNHLWAIADDVLRRETGADLSVLYPLLTETLRKAMTVAPRDAQTGPAVRGDRGVIDKHASLLAPDEAELYRCLSQHIIDYYSHPQVPTK